MQKSHEMVEQINKQTKTYFVAHKFDFSDEAIEIIEDNYAIYADCIKTGVNNRTTKSEKEFYNAVKGVDYTFTCTIAEICYEYHKMLGKRNKILAKMRV